MQPEEKIRKVIRVMSTKKENKIKVALEEGFFKLNEKQDKRIDEIENFVKTELKKISDQNKAVQGFIVREVKVNLENRLYNAECTFEAFMEVIGEHGIKIDNVNELIDTKKKEIHERKTKHAEAQMQANIQKEKEESKVSE